MPAEFQHRDGWAKSGDNNFVRWLQPRISVDAGSRAFSTLSGIISERAADAGVEATYQRRSNEWRLYAAVADNELKEASLREVAAEIHEAVVRADRDAVEKQFEQAMEAQEFHRNKYTNQELYSWMEAQTPSLHFQAYRLVHEYLEQAKLAYRFDLGLPFSETLPFDVIDDPFDALSGSRLELTLLQIKKAYLDARRRDYEIVKEISLMRLDPLALLQLKETGRCKIVYRKHSLMPIIPDITCVGSSRSASRSPA